MRNHEHIRPRRLTTLAAAVLGALAAVIPWLAAPASAEVQVSDVPARSWEVDGRVYAVKIVGDMVFVGGSFGRAIAPSGQQVTRRNLAAFSMSTGALLTDWRADTNGTVRVLAWTGTDLVVGGSYGTIGGTSQARIAKVALDDGAVDRQFDPQFNGAVRAAVAADGELFVGGDFTSVNGGPRERLVKLHLADGDVADDFNADASAPVHGLARAATGNRLYAAGYFTDLSGGDRRGVGAVDATTGRLTGPVFSSSDFSLGIDISDDGSRVFAARAAGSNSAAAWSTTTGARLWNIRAEGDVQAIRFYDDTVYFGFHDGFQGDNLTKVLAVDSLSGTIDGDFRPRIRQFGGVWAIDAGPAGVTLGGVFQAVSGVPARGVARFRA